LGQRLTTAAAIIRQNRANFHRFGILTKAPPRCPKVTQRHS
jgi:hypothetical protein